MEVPIQDDSGNYTNEVETIEGEINFYSGIDWDSENGVYNVSYSWDESTGSFDNVISGPPDKEEDFLYDLICQFKLDKVDSSR